MARLRNLAETVAALLVVLGTRTVEVLRINTQITGGLRAWRPAKVSPKKLMTCCDPPRLSKCYLVFVVSVSDQCPPKRHQHERRRPSVQYAPNAASSRNLGKAVVVVAAVLGSETAEVLVTQNSVARGTRASRPAQHSLSPR